MKRSKAFYRGCLVGGAIGDALTYPRKSMSSAALADLLGGSGFTDLICHEAVGKALVTDDTQLTVFTADGIIWADKRAREKGVYAYVPSIFYGYQKWYYTQTGHFADAEYEFLSESDVFRWEELFARRVPNSTALDALKLSTNGKHGTFSNRPNTLKTYGPLVRTAPLGMYFAENPNMAYKIGCQQAALTHGSPEVWYASGFVSALFAYLFEGQEPGEAIESALHHLREEDGAEEIVEAIRTAKDAAAGDGFYETITEDSVNAIPTLQIALYAMLRHPEDYAKAIISAANAKEEINGAASLTGQLLGANVGSLELPYNWIRKVELSDLLVWQADEILNATNAR